jgi:hypothetical protein
MTTTTDTFPALQEDSIELGRRANSLALLARQLRAACVMGDAEEVRAKCREIGGLAESMGDFLEAFALTSDHFVAYGDGEGGVAQAEG